MRNTIAALATSFLIAISPLALAQQRGPDLERMQEHLDLTDAQVEEIRQIKANGGTREDIRAVLTEEQKKKMRAHKQQMKEQRQGRDPNLEKMQQHLDLTDAQVEEIRQIKADGGSREDIKAVLTEEQQQKMQQHRKQMQGRGMGTSQADPGQ